MQEPRIEPYLSYLRQRLIIYEYMLKRLRQMFEKPQEIQENCKQLAESLRATISEGKISKPDEWLEEVFPGDFRSDKSARLFYTQYLAELYPSNLRELSLVAAEIDSIIAVKRNERMRSIRGLKRGLEVKLREVKNKISYELI